MKDPFSYFHVRYAEPKFQGSRLNGVARSAGDRQADKQTIRQKDKQTNRQTDRQTDTLSLSSKMSGFKYGIEEVDCCGCKVIKCLDCDAPAGESDTCPQQKPAQCYNYEAQSSHAKKTGCYQSHCEEKPQGHDVVNEVSFLHVCMRVCECACERA